MGGCVRWIWQGDDLYEPRCGRCIGCRTAAQTSEGMASSPPGSAGPSAGQGGVQQRPAVRRRVSAGSGRPPV